MPAMVPSYTNFVLVAAIDAVPAGATGQLKRIDCYHVLLDFDHYPAFVLDIYDTEPEVWKAIGRRPSSATRCVCMPRRRIAAAVAVGLVLGWLALPKPSTAEAVENYILAMNYFIGVAF